MREFIKDIACYLRSLWREGFAFWEGGESGITRLALVAGSLATAFGVSFVIPMMEQGDAPTWLTPTLFFAIFFLIAPFLAWRERKKESDNLRKAASAKLEIIWEVLVSNNRYGAPYEMYLAGVRNCSDTTSLENVTLHARDSWFTQSVIEPSTIYPDDTLPSQRRNPKLFQLAELHPLAVEKRQLFGVSSSRHMHNPSDVLAQRQRFTLEARARNTPTVTVDFEFDPNKSPRISRVTAP